MNPFALAARLVAGWLVPPPSLPPRRVPPLNAGCLCGDRACYIRTGPMS